MPNHGIDSKDGVLYSKFKNDRKKQSMNDLRFRSTDRMLLFTITIETRTDFASTHCKTKITVTAMFAIDEIIFSSMIKIIIDHFNFLVYIFEKRAAATQSSFYRKR